MNIEILFLEEFKKLIDEGKKTATCRRKKYGDVDDYKKIGDTFIVYDKTYMISQIIQCDLERVCKEFYKIEGFDSPDAFRKAWENIYEEYNGDEIVYLHIFERVR